MSINTTLNQQQKAELQALEKTAKDHFGNTAHSLAKRPRKIAKILLLRLAWVHYLVQSLPADTYRISCQAKLALSFSAFTNGDLESCACQLQDAEDDYMSLSAQYPKFIQPAR